MNKNNIASINEILQSFKKGELIILVDDDNMIIKPPAKTLY